MVVVRSEDLEFRQLPGRLTADPFEDGRAASSVRVVRLRRTPDRKAHRHPFSEEIVYVAEGTGKMWVAGDWVPLHPGDIVRIPPDTPHATVPDEDVEMRLVCFFPHPNLGENTRETEIIVGR